MNNMVQQLNEKTVELDSCKKETLVKTKLIAQLKTELNNLSNGSTDQIRKQLEIDKLSNKIGALNLDLSSIQAKLHEVS